MDNKKINIKSAQDVFNKLQVDPSSVAFAEEILDKKLLLKLKKSTYTEEKHFFKLLNLLENKSSNAIQGSHRKIKLKFQDFSKICNKKSKKSGLSRILI